jgi:2-methylcitrate dehydratase PrpD
MLRFGQALVTPRLLTIVWIEVNAMNLTKQLTEYAANLSYEQIPLSAIQVQKQSVIDSLGCIAAATGAAGRISSFAQVAKTLGGPGNCTLLQTGEKTTPMMAALANGALAHLMDYEDSHEKALVHPNAVSLPVMMALAEHEGGVNGKRFLTALVAASDICCRMDLGVLLDLLKYGWNMPPVFGGMGAVMGAGNLLGLSGVQISDALAINMSQTTSPGEAANSAGSMIRSVRDGFAAQAAVMSALLARQGLNARMEQALEGSLGFYHAFAHDQYDPAKVVADLGTVFQSERIDFKPWPCCRITHPTIDGLIQLLAENRITTEEITGIHVVLQEVGKMVLEPAEVKYHPKMTAMAKLSLPFAVGTLLKYGNITLDSFAEERFYDRDIERLGLLVTYDIDTKLSKEENKLTKITVQTARGIFAIEVSQPLGCRENPMSDAQLWAKFQDCLSHASKHFTVTEMNEIYDTANQLERLDDVGQFIGRLG